MNEQQKAAEEVRQTASTQRAMKDDYRTVFLKTPAGRRVMTDLLQFTGVLRPIIDIDNEKQSIFNAGQQSVGLLLIDILDQKGYDAIIELEKLGAELTKIGEDEL